MTDLQLVIRILLAAILGGFIGVEREVHGRAAGLRTHILVCVGSALIMLTAVNLMACYDNSGIDPFRIPAQVVSGIGFLGAGTIIRFRASIRGLTTAASLWVSAAIGLAIGSGFYKAAFLTAAVILVSLLFLTKLESKMLRKDWYRTLRLITDGGPNQLGAVREILSDHQAEIRDFEIKKIAEGKLTLEFRLKLITAAHNDEIIADLSNVEGIENAKWLE